MKVMAEAVNQHVQPVASRKMQTLPPLTLNAAMRWDAVTRLLPLELGDVLEIGCGRGGFAARLAERAGRLLGIEPDAASFASARANLDGRATILNITFDELPADLRFDTLCAFEVLEHIKDDRASLSAWTDRLRPGGTLLLSMPAWNRRMSDFDMMVGHFRRYDPSELHVMLDEAGLIDIKIELYGFPLGLMLEQLRNGIARMRPTDDLAGRSYAARTAGSGRLWQPDRGILGRIVTMMAIPPVRLQRLFPDRGVGLVARARRPI